MHGEGLKPCLVPVEELLFRLVEALNLQLVVGDLPLELRVDREKFLELHAVDNSLLIEIAFLFVKLYQLGFDSLNALVVLTF